MPDYAWKKVGPVAVPPGSPGLLVNGKNECIGAHFIREVGAAERSVRLISPIIESTRVVDALAECRRRQVKVKLLTELSDDRTNGEPRFIVKHTRSVPADAHSHAICRKRLGEAMIWCRSDTHYNHAKLWIVDERVAFIGSANLTDNSLGFGNPAIETMLRVDDATIVSALAQTFDAFWKRAEFRQHLHNHSLRVELKKGKSLPSGTCRLEMDNGGALLWNVPEQEDSLLEEILKQLERAKSEVILCARSMVDLHRLPDFRDAVAAALGRGVRIIVLVAQNAFREDQYPDSPTQELITEGLVLRGWAGLHAKGILVDGKTAIQLSGNFNPSLDWKNPDGNIECGMVCSLPSFAAFGRYLQALADLAPYYLARCK